MCSPMPPKLYDISLKEQVTKINGRNVDSHCFCPLSQADFGMNFDHSTDFNFPENSNH